MRIRKGLACLSGTAEERKTQRPMLPSLLPVLQPPRVLRARRRLTGWQKKNLHSGGSFRKNSTTKRVRVSTKRLNRIEKALCVKKKQNTGASVKSSV